MNENRIKIMEARNLSTWFPVKRNITDVLSGKPKDHLKAVDNVNLTVYQGESLGLVGESGCGKSTLAKTLIRLYEATSGQVFLQGKEITHSRGKKFRQQRKAMQMIFQDPYSSLNPRMTVYEVLEEMLKVHKMVPAKDIRNRINELLETCGLSMSVADRFPGEFSGGQRQRIGIARSLALQPKLLLADEPVSALDVSIQAQIINLLGELQNKLDLTILFISHDLHVVRFITQRVIVMYLGNIVETGNTEAVFTKPLHPYSLVLTSAVPILDPRLERKESSIQGEPPSPIDIPTGCPFHPRCSRSQAICREKKPLLRERGDERSVACHFPLDGEAL